jgi:hypothetical protein
MILGAQFFSTLAYCGRNSHIRFVWCYRAVAWLNFYSFYFILTIATGSNHFQFYALPVYIGASGGCGVLPSLPTFRIHFFQADCTSVKT